jgi:hypothetical protein
VPWEYSVPSTVFESYKKKMTFAAFDGPGGMCSVEKVLGPEKAGGMLGRGTTRSLKKSHGLGGVRRVLSLRVLLKLRRAKPLPVVTEGSSSIRKPRSSHSQ